MSAPNPIATRELATRGLGASVVALAVNFALGWVALSRDLVGSTEFFQYPAIAVWTLLGMGGATIVYRVLTRRSATPDRTFVRVAVVVLLLHGPTKLNTTFAIVSVRASGGPLTSPGSHIRTGGVDLSRTTVRTGSVRDERPESATDTSVSSVA